MSEKLKTIIDTYNGFISNYSLDKREDLLLPIIQYFYDEKYNIEDCGVVLSEISTRNVDKEIESIYKGEYPPYKC